METRHLIELAVVIGMGVTGFGLRRYTSTKLKDLEGNSVIKKKKDAKGNVIEGTDDEAKEKGHYQETLDDGSTSGDSPPDS
ncbi:hypothetical protein M2454_000965 [Aequitasia blattaphilus]|uniref:Uncharacterized protein n=1 Tax=Aequitasia blattaphilus TaxID=2949332 RepID=A0ABT1ED80_9FIRM|nr:hypothetical protein [Aequitasia blattaphilus]MCP1102427.1 hypothetical protein [Aequitasia blattaphilus]MCR8615067.1 hypothetical protein [Aequitasia blattaphilus]